MLKIKLSTLFIKIQVLLPVFKGLYTIADPLHQYCIYRYFIIQYTRYRKLNIIHKNIIATVVHYDLHLNLLVCQM